MGNDRHSRFRQDAWIGHTPLNVKYQDLNGFTTNSDSLVSDRWNGSTLCISFRRNCFDWGIHEVALLLGDLDNVALNVKAPDSTL